MRRLSVDATHLEMCIEKSVYALGPNEPDMQPGELLVLHLNKMDARRQRIQDGRANFVLVLDRAPEYDDGTCIRQFWQKASSHWRWLLYGSVTIPTIPFSLDDPALGLSKSYSIRGLANSAVKIEKEDAEKIERYILGALAEKPDLTHQRVPVSQIIQEFEEQRVLSALRNHDYIVRLRAKSRGAADREKCEPNPYLAEILASYYEYRCQICRKDCSSDYYGVPFYEAYHIQGLAQGGLDISENMMILCPDHHRIIEVTNAHFNRDSLSFEYPNGRREPLCHYTHFEIQHYST